MSVACRRVAPAILEGWLSAPWGCRGAGDWSGGGERAVGPGLAWALQLWGTQRALSLDQGRAPTAALSLSSLPVEGIVMALREIRDEDAPSAVPGA